ncbi:MAG TPA: amino acid adenylation domain-containing protein [Polyangia bacterium]|jgi:natural product biosynthesis luciferase-like monooxygenase protein/amino acid adenylation domain-containing protein|nr:amino acid adenylation domain-containing protein [Polyangia bacterium]
MAENEAMEVGPGDIAIIGLAGEFPGARSVAEFWRHLRQGQESIARFSPEEVEPLPGLPEGMALAQHPRFVPAGGVLADVDRFDHEFFGLPLREAQWMDPQQRRFLQCVVTALEDAGCDPERFEGRISLYAGATDSGYAQAVRRSLPLDPALHFEVSATATHEALATRVSYKLGLTGESLLVYTACSTGLVAVHMACQSLLLEQSDVALAGATRIVVPQRTGYVYQEGMIFSPDGHCRAFDARAQGTVGGNGVAVVVLRRLADAVRDGDPIRAVIKGSAINNDGYLKSGYTAPSVQGQAAVIEQALAYANLEPADIGYVEAHGTGTPLGDPIEVAALMRAYGLGPERRGTIPMGSVKTNIGHLDTVAGLAGLIKTVLALEHEEIPPSLHFERANPQIDFDGGPFFVNTRLLPWPRERGWDRGRRAAVSSFGIGGTNAHAVLEEAPELGSGPSARARQLVLLSARTAAALETMSRELAAYVEAHPEVPLADVAFTRALGRRGFELRRPVVARDGAELVERLRQAARAVEVDSRSHVSMGQDAGEARGERRPDGLSGSLRVSGVVRDLAAGRQRRVAFLLPGQGAQQVGMGRELYEAEPVFREAIDECLGRLEASLREEVRGLLRPEAGELASRRLLDTRVALPALFMTEWALARLWMDWGVRPHALLGHSYGEYVAACLAGVLSVEDGLRLAVARGRMMSRLPPGAMLAVGLSEAEVRALLSSWPGALSLAAVNAPGRSVISGPVAEVERLQEELERREVAALRLPAPHAFHSAAVEPLMPELVQVVASLERSLPALRYVSSLTGTWARPEAVTDPRYWADQMRQPVRFAEGVDALLQEGCSLLVEVGPGQDLTGLARACLGEAREQVQVVPSLVRAGSRTSEHATLLGSLGELWAQGLAVDWRAFYAGEQRRRVPLPTYPFQEKRCWVEAPRERERERDREREREPAPTPVSAWLSPAAPTAQPAPAAAFAPEPEPDLPLSESAPRGPIEEQVAALWRERLGLAHVGRDDNFLELGGNSLTAAQLLNQLRDTFGVQLPLADLFEAPTVAGTAARIAALLAETHPASASSAPSLSSKTRALALAPLDRTGELALSYVQERVWRLEQFLPGLSAYNIPFVLRLEGPLDVATLERSLQEIVRRHEALRTTYDVVEGRPVQRFHDTVEVPLVRVALAGTAEAREAEALRLAREDAARPFDLVRGPVLRTTLLVLGEALHVLLCNVHHVVCDTLSAGLFIHELGQLYGAFRQGKPSPLAPLRLQYADFGAWQRRSVLEGSFADEEQWWRKELAGLPRQLDLPLDLPGLPRLPQGQARPAVCPLTSARLPIEFPPRLAEALTAFGRREGYTTYTLLLAAWQALLHRYSGQTDIVVGTPIANRTRPELQPLIGYVAHSVALRTDFSDDPTFRELLGRVHDVVLRAQDHANVPFEYLVEQLLPGRDTGRGRLTDSIFVLHSGGVAAGPPPELAGLRVTLLEVPGTPVQWGTTLADLSLVLAEAPGRVSGALEYATELFSAARAARMVEHLHALLAAGLARPEERVSRLPLATEEEQRAWPRPRPAPSSVGMLERLRGHAAGHPEAVAVMQGERRWSWAALAARARRLAERLRALGVEKGEPVAVCLRSSPEKLAALWGVLEAGAAVVALGPTDLGQLPAYLAPARERGGQPLLVTWRGMGTSARLEASRVLYVEDVIEEGEGHAALAPVAAHERPSPPETSLACLVPVGTAQPAWVLTHGGLGRLCRALDERLGSSAGGDNEGGAWLAAGGGMAERLELEPLWALSRGLRVVFPPEDVAGRLRDLAGGGRRTRPVELSLMYFANDEDALRGPKYEQLLEGAKFADAHGFTAVWTPERHFHSFGGLYPQPAVVAAALATITRHLRLRAGSVVLPLHDPLLVAEQWSVVDNLSGGRVGLSMATGWHVHDFTYAPERYADRRAIALRHLQTLRALWRGESMERPGGGGVPVTVSLRPRPVQRELPVWLTAPSHPETFRLAGELGAGVLTSLLAHDLAAMTAKVELYREAWRRSGHPGRGHVTLMLHTFIGAGEAEALATVRQPLLRYFRSSVDIITTLFASQGYQGEIDKMSEEDITVILERTFEYHAYQAGLIGTIESGLRRLEEVRAADVDEVACLVDFGLETPVMMEGLARLAELRARGERDAAVREDVVLVEGAEGVGALLELTRREGAVFVQAPARLGRSLAESAAAPAPSSERREALGPVRAVVLEEGSAELGTFLRQATGAEVLLAGAASEGWLLPRALGAGGEAGTEEPLPAGLQAWVLDAAGRPVPVGVVGELALGGAGLPEGLWQAPEAERQRLVAHPLDAAERLYRTGRRARLRPDGGVEPVAAPPAPARPARPRTEAPRKAPSSISGPGAAALDAPTAIPRVPHDRPLVLSFAQQRLWYLQQLEPESAAYNNPAIFRLRGRLDVAALQAALDELVRRHEVLRTTYTLTEDGPVQIIHPPPPSGLASGQTSGQTSGQASGPASGQTGGVPLALEDVQGETAEDREAAVLRRCQAHLGIPFDLERGPVLRALLLRVGPEEHVLSLVLHHIISDAWCSLVLAQELVALYTAFGAGRPSPLPPLPVQYADYAVWQREWLAGAVLAAQLDWWKRELTGVPALELPLDRPRPKVQSYAGGAHHFLVPPKIVEPLLALGRREGATPFMVLLALYQALLGRYSGQEDFAVGTPTAGRTRPEVTGLIGCFVNTLALRASLGGRPSFRRLLAEVRRKALGAYAHQEVPFERLVEVLQVPRSLDRTPVFQVMINLVNTPEASARHEALELGVLEVPADTAKFDLSLDVFERQGGLSCRFEYATSLFEPATVARLAGHLAALAEAVVAEPDRPLSELPLLTTEEREAVLRTWQGAAVSYPAEACIHTLFEAAVARSPGAVAVWFEGASLTYEALDRRANQLAHHLRGLGVGPEVRVAVCAERSLELVVALLGVLKAGGAYVPLDPDYPRERLGWMLEDARPEVVLFQHRLVERLPPLAQGMRQLRLDADGAEVAHRPETRPAPLARAEHLAYVIFTSGSTGRPKGAMNTHRAVCNQLLWLRDEYGIGPGDVVLQKAPYGFDASVSELFCSLITGARLVLARPGGHQEPAYLVRLIAEQGVTLADFVPSMLQVFLEEPGVERCTGLRGLLAGGEALPVELKERCLERLPRAELHNLYGPTEAAIQVTYFTCQARDGRRTVPIGRPVANTVIRILDADREPVPVGVPGELCIGGAQLGRGYEGRPDLTAERFIPDALGDVPGARLYRTGDLVRWGTDGNIEYLGRTDFQVKVRGVRIELGEIEAALVQHRAVLQAVVLGREDVPGEKRLVAYVVARPGEAGVEVGALRDVLRQWLRERLPESMVPSAIVSLPSFALTPSGKVDRKALPPPEAGAASARSVQPRNSWEQKIAELYAGLLQVDSVGVDEDFFSLGGHSLLGMRLISRIRAVFGVELPVRVLFEAPTVAALAERVEEAAGGRRAPETRDTRALSDDARATITPIPRDGELPLSFAQQRLWFLDRLAPGSPFYNIPVAVRVTGALSVEALERSLGEVVRRHEALRTRFETREAEGRRVQRIAPRLDLPLARVDLAPLPEDVREARALALAREEAQRPFDLEHGPLLRATLLGLGPEDHVLLLTMHHIVSDGWSMDVLVRELGALYPALAEGRPAPLPALSIQYADYAAWQREWLAGDVLDRQLAYWKRQLGGALPVLELPAHLGGRPRPPVQTHRGAQHLFTLPAALSAALASLSRQEGVTLFMTLLAAFQTLLHRYTGQDDVIVGSPIAGRTRPETEGLIGFFVNTLALRTDLGGQPRFRDLLGRVREVTLGAYAHQDVPFEKLVEVLQPERDLGRSPVFQVLFVLQNLPATTLELPGLTLQLLAVDGGVAKFDLTMSLEETGEGLLGALEYNTDLFAPATMARLAQHFRTLLEGIVAHPEHTLAELPLLTEAERHTLVHEWNPARGDALAEVCLHALFEAQAERAPEAVALVCGDASLTYGTLNRRADELARHLRALGVGPEVRVGLLLDRSLELVVSLLAVLKAGGAYVPLDPLYPAERIAFILDDARAPVLLTERRHQEALAGAAAKVVYLDQLAALPAPAEEVLGPAARPEQAAYVIYTSGSTGRPKGVVVEHRQVSRLLGGAEALFGLGPADVWTLFHSYAFDFSVWELWGALAYGGRLVVVPFDVSRSPADFHALLVREQVTVLNQTPSAFRQLVAADAEAPAGAQLALRYVIFGGEAVDLASVRAWMERHGDERPRLVNMYGITETTVHVTHRVLRREEGPGVASPVGRALPDWAVYLLGPSQELVPVGVPGEIYVGGAGVTRGYLDRPGLTAERFVPDPFARTPGARLYRSGDLGRWREGGELEYLGRADHQVKIRGFRIELGEIEAALAAHPGVRQAAVVAREDRPGDQRLVAYVVAQAAPIEGGELRAALKARLPEYMVPASFVLLDELPLTPSGKLDRRALPAPEAAAVARTSIAPRTPTEALLAVLWADVLGGGVPGVEEHFFERGGHSLLAIQLLARIRAAMGVELPVRALFEAPTLAGLGQKIDAACKAGAALRGPALVPLQRTEELPLSFAQQRLWFLDQLEPGRPFYNIPAALRLVGELDVDALRQSFDELLRRHEALRTSFVAREGQPGQRIRPALPLPLVIADLMDVPEAVREARALERVREEALRPFDLAEAPLLRVVLLRLGLRDHVLVITVHHIVSDGWSMGILVRELAALYRAFGRRPGQEPGQAQGWPPVPPLEPLPVQYADFALWQRAWLEGEALEEQLHYWKQQLGGRLPVLELPTDRPRPAVETHRGAQLGVTLPAALSEALAGLSRREGVTLFMTLLAAFQTLLHRYTGQDDVIVGTPIAGRTRPETEGLIGFFVNTLALRTDLGGDPRFVDLLGRVREVTLGAYGHQDVPFEKLVEVLQPERDLGRAPVFQVLFVLQNLPATALDLPGLTLTPIEIDGGIAKFDLTLTLQESQGGAGGLRGVLEYNTDLFDAATMERMAGHLRRLLEGVVEDPERRVAELPLLTEEEREQLLERWNQRPVVLPGAWSGGGVEALFAEEAARRPEAPAVVFGDDCLTYGELDRRSNQLAHHLRALGVREETLVGVCVERSPELVVGLLGVLKAGGAYLPLDPTYPQERLAFMLEDAGVRLVLTQRHLGGVIQNTAEVALDQDWHLIPRHGTTAPGHAATAEHLAYVIYTSGSTGRPKGTLLLRGGLTNTALTAARHQGLEPGRRVLQFAALGFDASVFEIFSALVSGACVVLAPRDELLPGGPLGETIRRQGVTSALLPPSVIAEMEAETLPLETLVSGGEACPQGVVDRWGGRLRLLNAYGPTETTVCATISEPLGPGDEPVIGGPWDHARLFVLDAHGQPVPVGVPGELHIGGAGLARGYLGRPELTAERFVPDPFSHDPGARLYRTGDVVRWRPGGRLAYVGRRDHQVKLRGFRIELGEVEAALAAHEDVRQAVVVMREEGAGDRRLVGYVVGREGRPLGAQALRASLKERLPEYMVPSAFVFLAELPRTPSGKLDRRSLPAPEAGAQGALAGPLLPRDDLERTLALLWEEVLGVRPIGVQQNFFELGGHSLLAARLAARVQKALGQPLSLMTLFRHPTVEELAAALRRPAEAVPPAATPHRTILCMKPGRAGTRPLVLVHGGGGNAYRYTELARHLHPEQPVFALQAPGLDGGGMLPASIEAIARHYIEQVRGVLSEGACVLGGWSLGGVVAFEMAQQLRQAGVAVPLLVLIDSHAPPAEPAPMPDELHLLAAFGRTLGLDEQRLGLDPASLQGLTVRARLEAILELARRHDVSLDLGDIGDLGLDEAERYFAVFRNHQEALHRYLPRPYLGPALLLRARTQAAPQDAGIDLGWGTWIADDLTITQVPGDHETLLTAPDVTSVAEALTKRL